MQTRNHVTLETCAKCGGPQYVTLITDIDSPTNFDTYVSCECKPLMLTMTTTTVHEWPLIRTSMRTTATHQQGEQTR